MVAILRLAQSAGVIEHANSISAEGSEPHLQTI